MKPMSTRKVCELKFVYCHVLTVDADGNPQTEVPDVYTFWKKKKQRDALKKLDSHGQFAASTGEKYQIRSSAGAHGVVVFADIDEAHIDKPFGFPEDKLKTSPDEKVKLLPVVVKLSKHEYQSGVQELELAKEKTAYKDLWQTAQAERILDAIPRIPHFYEPKSAKGAKEYLIIDEMAGVPVGEVLDMMQDFVINKKAGIDPNATVSVKGRVSLVGDEGRDLSSVEMPFWRFLMLLLLEGVYHMHGHGMHHCDMNDGNILLPLQKEAIDEPFGFQIPGKDGAMVSTEISAHNLQLIDISRMITTKPEKFGPCLPLFQPDIARLGCMLYWIVHVTLAQTPGHQKALEMLSALLDPAKSCLVNSRELKRNELIQCLTDDRLPAGTEAEGRRQLLIAGLRSPYLIAKTFDLGGKQRDVDLRGGLMERPWDARGHVTPKYEKLIGWMQASCSRRGEDDLMREIASLALDAK